MFRNMMVRLQDSPETEFAVGAALAFAKGYGSTLTGLYVRPAEAVIVVPDAIGRTVATLTGGVATEEEADVYAATEGERQARTVSAFEIMARKAGVPFHCDVRSGAGGQTFADSAATADLVSMPRGEDDRGAIGCEMELLVKSVPHPFLLASEQIVALKRIAVAYDGSPGAMRALSAAADIAMNWTGAPLDILVVEVLSGDQAIGAHLDAAAEYLRVYDLACRTRALAGPAGQAIANFAQSEEIDLLCMGAYGHTTVREYFFGSTTHEVVKRRRKPILLCH